MAGPPVAFVRAVEDTPPWIGADSDADLTAADVRAAVATHGSPLLLLSTDTIQARVRALQAALPRVEHHYAIKALPQVDVLRAAMEAGASFDVATTGEIALLREIGADPSRCIHTHPIKRPADIEAALDFGIRTFVYDNAVELTKLAPYADRVELLLRLEARNPSAKFDLSYKFGAPASEAVALMEQARALGLRTRGTSFHVGSQVEDAGPWLRAIEMCRQVWDEAAEVGIQLDTLDIGGGFPVPYLRPVPSIAMLAAPIERLLDELFPDARLIAEPGRYIAGPSMTLVCSVVGKATRSGRTWYYLDDGVYGSFNGRHFDKGDYHIRALSGDGRSLGGSEPSVLSGPTCDSIDIVYEDFGLPELQVGDHLLSPMMGAYTAAASTDFNLVPRARVVAAPCWGRLRSDLR